MPRKDSHAMGEPLVTLSGRLPQSVLARIDAYVESMRRATPGLNIGRSDAFRILLVQALDAIGAPTAHAETETETGTPHKPPRARKAKKTVTDTVTDTSAQTEAERVAIRALQGVTDTITDTSTEPALSVTDTVTDTEIVTDTVTVTAPSMEPFDTTRYYLGKLCPKGHNYHGTGQSLLRQHNQRCRACENEAKRGRYHAKRQEVSA